MHNTEFELARTLLPQTPHGSILLLNSSPSDPLTINFVFLEIPPVTLCQYILLVLIRIYNSVEPKFCDRYLLNVSARCHMNLLALNSLRLPSFELSDNQKLGDDTGVAFWLKIHSKN